MQVIIDATRTPPIGDVRALGDGDVIWLGVGWNKLPDAGRYRDAVSVALSRGANAIHIAWATP